MAIWYRLITLFMEPMIVLGQPMIVREFADLSSVDARWIERQPITVKESADRKLTKENKSAATLDSAYGQVQVANGKRTGRFFVVYRLKEESS